jgi:hypothetical protein
MSLDREGFVGLHAAIVENSVELGDFSSCFGLSTKQ